MKTEAVYQWCIYIIKIIIVLDSSRTHTLTLCGWQLVLIDRLLDSLVV